MRKYILTILLIVVIFNGLSNVRELTDLAMVKAIGIDIDEEGMYLISAIVADTTSEDEKNKGIIYTARGKSVHEAARNMVDISPKKLYIAHMETLIISEEIAKNHLENSLDFFIRDNEGSNSFYVFISNGNDAFNTINAINEQEIDLVPFLKSTQKYKGNANLKTLNDLLKDLLEDGTNLCINSVAIKDNEIYISDMAYFSEWNMQGYLTPQESILYNILISQSANSLVSVGEGDDLIVVEILSPNINFSIDKSKENCVKVNINLDAHVTQTGKNVVINNINEKDNVEKKIEEKIKGDVENFYNKIKYDYKIDIINLGNLLYRKKNKLYENSNYLEQLNINVVVKVNIKGLGGVKKVW